ncbi:hypothetical protein MPC38_06785 [Prescottella equi]|uniref:hypothetical protein n=1 Tax=Rhodococcus hoagii TaxID=43767 RepID=UPI001F5B421F|nr:hypothetical protein [Prescottella equi]UNQ40951.1 hypothetical protein MPC38_06785 [Prescottella equi]
MNNETVGAIEYDAKINTSTLKSSANQADSIVSKSVAGTEQSVRQSTDRMKNSLDGVPESIAAIGTAYLSITSLSNFLTDSIDEANRMQASMLGLTTISNAYGQSAITARSASKQLAEDGLMSVTEAGTALKNLLASGFSLDEAITLVNRFKDTAAFGRQSALGFGEAITSATEGIKNGNSILVDNAGVTKNLSVILQEAGKSQQDVMNVTSDASVRQALYNGLLKETAANLGDSSRLAQTAAGADAALNVQAQYLQVTIGQLANTIRQPLVQGLTEFIAGNQQAIISIGSGVVAFAVFAAGAYASVKALAVLRVALTAISRHPAVAVIGLVFGVFAGAVMDKMMSNLESAGDSMYDFGDATGKAGDSVNGLSKEAAKLQKQLAQIDDQIAKTNRDFNESLAEMVRDHKKSAQDLTKQIKEENDSYTKAYNERLDKFNEDQEKEAESHQQKVVKLQAQIDFLRRYNNASNAQQLSELQFALARENSEYDKKLAERQTKYDQDAAAEKATFDARTLELQTKLNAENELLAKHAADVASIRDVQLLDEIDKLKRSRNEQLASLNQQKLDAISNASQTAAGVGAAYGQLGSDMTKGLRNSGDAAGRAMGDAFKASLQAVFTDMWNTLADFANNNPFNQWIKRMADKFGKAANNNDFKKFFEDAGKNFGSWVNGRRAYGGPVSAGNAYVVGENKDGSWNKTTELFVPNTSGTIIPNKDLTALTGGGSQGDVSISISMSGVMTRSAADERAIAKRLIDRINEELRAKGRPELGVAR